MDTDGPAPDVKRTEPRTSTLLASGLLLALAGGPAAFGAAPTYNTDVAPIIHKHCTPCHQPSQPGPFNLLSFADVQKRARQIVEVTSKRLMPPWLPEPGYGQFRDARRLSDAELRTLAEWTAGGCEEGHEHPAPKPPLFADGWPWGEPDLVVTLPEVYRLTESGEDVWRSFVIPAPLDKTRHVRAMAFLPGNKAVHHAAVRLDRTPQSRVRDAADPGFGFGGIVLPDSALPPAGHMLNWLPGRQGYRSPEGMPWPFEGGADLVVQLHLQPTGRNEDIRPRIGFYFTDQMPTNQLVVFPLRVRTLDIPAGESRYLAKDSFVLPVDSTVIWINPHAHFLGEELKGFARLPDRSLKWLFWIKQWNFNWQDDYTLQEPVLLPKGTELVMEYFFNNSETNPFNPAKPPRQVRFGQQSTDEMAELWIQLLPAGPADRAVLERALQEKMLREMGDYYTHRVKLDPADAKAYARLGFVASSQGRMHEAELQLLKAKELDPKDDDTRVHLALYWMSISRPADAEAELEAAVTLNERNALALGVLGYLKMKRGDLVRAEDCLNKSLSLNPKDESVRSNLKRLEQLKARRNR